jgi:hypothetical protein
MFTVDNTTGYTQAQIDALNAELAARLAHIDENDIALRQQIEQTFADEVARR